MTTNRRETIWLGSTEPEEDDINDYGIAIEDDMVAITCFRADGSELEVFICPNLFDVIKATMHVIEKCADAGVIR